MNHTKRIEKLEAQLHTGPALIREVESLVAELKTLITEEEFTAYLAKVEAEIFGGRSPCDPTGGYSKKARNHNV